MFHDGARIASCFVPSDPKGELMSRWRRSSGRKSALSIANGEPGARLLGLAARERQGRALCCSTPLRVIAGWPLARIKPRLRRFPACPNRAPMRRAAARAGADRATVFEPAFCKLLIDYYAKNGGAVSGSTARERGRQDLDIRRRFQERSDCMIEDQNLREKGCTGFIGASARKSKSFRLQIHAHGALYRRLLRRRSGRLT